MPPKRGARGGTRGGGRAASRPPGPQEMIPTTKLSTSYGSPAPNTLSRTLNSGSAFGAISQVLGSVNTANEEDANELDRVVHAKSGRWNRVAETKVPSPQPGPMPRNPPPAESEGEDSSSDDADTGDDRERMPPPSRRPVRDNRSFTEEGNLYTGAGVETPRSRSIRSQTPSRSSARIAAQNGGVNMSPLPAYQTSSGPQQLGYGPSSGAQSSYAAGREDHDPTGLGVHRAYEPDVLDRTDLASRRRDATRSSIMNRDHGTDTGPEQSGSSSSNPGTRQSEGWVSDLTNLWSQMWQGGWTQRLVCILLLWGILALLCVIWLIFLQVTLPPSRWEGVKVSRNYTTSGLATWRQTIAQFIPWVILHPFAVLTGNLDYVDFRTALQWAEWNHQSNSHRLDYLAGATGQMRRILPELIAIRVDKETNEWAPGDSFWNALSAEMKQGGLHHIIPTLEASVDGTYSIADNHWGAIRKRIVDEGSLISDQPAGADGAISYNEPITTTIERSVSQRWDEWLKDNDDAIKRIQGFKYDQIYGDLEKKLLDRIHGLNLEERMVSREEFLEKIRHVSNEYAAQIRNELKAMEGKLSQAIAIAESLKQDPNLPAGMSREQLNTMLNEAVTKAVQDAQIESIANGNIQSHLETLILHEKNYFNTLRGAIVDTSLSSATYQWAKKVVPAKDEIKHDGLIDTIATRVTNVLGLGGKNTGVDLGPHMALERWEEDGECWCAGHNDNTSIADLSVMTSSAVLPQYLVVEHIAASGTFDPKAMPKDLELWLRIPRGLPRNTLLAWSQEMFFGNKSGNDPQLLKRGFVKVGDFRYDNAAAMGTKQVFELSEHLVALGGQSQQVLVRSTSNYGAEDHTCFYRLRLFGVPGEDDTYTKLYGPADVWGPHEL